MTRHAEDIASSDFQSAPYQATIPVQSRDTFAVQVKSKFKGSFENHHLLVLCFTRMETWAVSWRKNPGTGEVIGVNGGKTQL